MTLRTLVIAGFCALVGLVWIIESGAADVFLEAARPDFQKFHWPLPELRIWVVRSHRRVA